MSFLSVTNNQLTYLLWLIIMINDYITPLVPVELTNLY